MMIPSFKLFRHQWKSFQTPNRWTKALECLYEKFSFLWACLSSQKTPSEYCRRHFGETAICGWGAFCPELLPSCRLHRDCWRKPNDIGEPEQQWQSNKSEQVLEYFSFLHAHTSGDIWACGSCCGPIRQMSKSTQTSPWERSWPFLHVGVRWRV